MRVLVVHNFYAQPGGEDTVVRAEVDALRAAGHDVDLLGLESAALMASPVRGACETLSVAVNLAAGARVMRAARAFRPDVAHVHNLFPRFGLEALRALARADVPVVQTLHNFRWLCAKATLWRDDADCRLCAGGSFGSAIRHACVRGSHATSAAYAAALALNRRTGLAARVVAKFVCPSRFVARVHEDAGFAPGKMAVAGHFVPSVYEVGSETDGSIIYAGRLAEEKGLGVLARAAARLPGVTIKIAGDGPEREAWERAFATPGGARVTWLGRLSRAALADELRRSAVCVVPSVGTETFGLAAIEAFACGRPVVASDAGGLPEVIRHGEDGFVVPRGDDVALAERLRWLVDHRDEAAAFGRRGWQRVKTEHLPGPHVARLAAIYAEASGASKENVTKEGG